MGSDGASSGSEVPQYHTFGFKHQESDFYWTQEMFYY